MKINAVIESRDGGTLVLDFPRSIYDVYEKLQSVGIRKSPHQIALCDEECDDVRVKLYSEDEVGKHLLLTLNEQNSLADANMLVFMVDNAKADFRSKLEQNLLHDQYSSMQEVTDDIKQMLYESGPVKAVFYCPLVGEVTDDEGFSYPVDGRFLKSYSLHGVVEWIDKHKAKEYKRNGKHVACLTYTNAAVEVIASRIFSDSFIIPSTIHSFAWENIQNFRSSLVVAAKELDFIPSDHTVEEVKRVVYDLGIRYLEEDGTLHLFHDDIIKIFAWFLDKEKFRMLLSDKYPLILIDEYQDTFKIITDKFLTYFIDLGKGPQFGFFGDSWQTIYASNGACGSIQSENIIEIKKGSNFRSQAVIVDALNQIRPNLPQISALDENDGEIIVITTNEFIGQRSTERNYKDDLPDQVLSSYINAVQEKLKKRGWGSDNKVLMITHRMLARHQNYPNLFDALGDHFREQDDVHFVFFRDRIEPLYNALVLNDTKLMFDALGAGRRPIETKKQKKQWQAVKRGLEIARQGTIYDVLKAAYDSRLIPIQPEIERLKKLYEAEEPQEYHKTTLARFYAIQYEEVVRAINFFKVDGMYSTDHGVKGEEYDNVLLVMGRGWNLYKFEDILWKEESQLAGNDLKAYIRNRNLFYVCCSRPRKRLAILITVPISDQFRNYLNRVFGTQNVIEYTRFIKW